MLTPQQQQVLRLIIASQGMSRTALAQKMGISKAAISGVIKEMLADGLLAETDAEANGQGRPAVRLKMRADSAYFIGVSLLGAETRMVLIDMHGKTLIRKAIPLEPQPEALAEGIARALPDLLVSKKIRNEQVIGLGVTLSGFVDEKQETCVQSALLGWRNVPLAALLKQKTGLDVSLENDAKALAVSEKLFGVAKDIKNFTVITHSDGIGSAHYLQGNLNRGAHGGAGEIAHCTIELGGTPCRCGKRGCLDTIASLIAIREMTQAKGLPAGSVDELEKLAAAGNTSAIAILHRAGSALGLAIANIIQLNDPELVVIAHHPQAFEGLLRTVVLQSIESNVLPGISGKTPVSTIIINEDTWARAAASIAAHRFLIHLPD
ncbi:ROK family transcriptional regulator [Brenneria izadpanahii]|uniref:ROK family transcriptional regulator n=1 Tax=Brenneria izadpanahii TaxID=2722756 RepID=A0ABX7UR83_9GAMM|nr:ROK family transcriptional regulator [Brenneria izadpanahii]QTF07845.1 ROK family transcriptional regulator [Brenneria izadpanahii]